METGSSGHVSDSPFPKTIFLGVYLHGEIPLITGTAGQLEEEESRRRNELMKQRRYDAARANATKLTKWALVKKSLKNVARQARADSRGVLKETVSYKPPLDLIPETTPLKIKQLIQLNSVACGVPNVSNIQIFNELSLLINEFFEGTKHFLTKSRSLEKFEWYINLLRNVLIYKNEPYLKQILSEIREIDISTLSEPEKKRAESIQQFLHSTGKAYEIHTFSEGDPIMNKKFIKLNPYELEGDIGPYVNKIVEYNTKVDIIEMIEEMVDIKMRSITLFNMIDFLHSLGVETIIIVDLSCSIFVHNDVVLTDPRLIRALRRSMGGKRKTLKKKHFYKYKLYGNH